tara:strand:+ start:413 stop:757 length:345 start_codon:yes stop_codon:yes gene_type:complete
MMKTKLSAENQVVGTTVFTTDGLFYFKSWTLCSFLHNGSPLFCARFYDSSGTLIGLINMKEEDFLKVAATLPRKQINDQLRVLAKKESAERGPVEQRHLQHDKTQDSTHVSHTV